MDLYRAGRIRGHGHLNDKNLNLKGELTVTEQHGELEAKYNALPSRR